MRCLKRYWLGVFIKRSPFDGTLAFGKPLPNLIAELTFVAAAAVCLVAAAVALREASQARVSNNIGPAPQPPSEGLLAVR